GRNWFAWLLGFPGRAHGCCGEHAPAPQHGRLHAVLLLSVGSAGASAGVVQVGTLPLPGGRGPPRRAARFRRGTSCRHGISRVGFDLRGTVSRPSRASARDRGVERGTPRIDRDARLHDRDWATDVAGRGATMNGAHDMGGSHGFGPVVPEVREPTFHAEWERRVFALTLAAGRPGKWNIDMGRFARENRPHADYL